MGLNLQSGSALINLDVPWNPAVLEQRNGRIHRLGQTRTVQIITMVAQDSYEEQVLNLVGSKQNLFDNVVREDASEDMVGISKKLLETLIEELAVPDESESAVPAGEAPGETESAAVQKVKQRAQVPRDTHLEEEIRCCIERLQEQLGSRIERILGAQGGLIAVLDQVDEAAEGLAVELSATIPVALIDHLALKGLARLAGASPLAGAETYFLKDQEKDQKEEAAGPSRLVALAREKLEAAGLVFNQQLESVALELLLSALLAKAADLAGLNLPPEPSAAAVWLYSEALPNKILTQDEAGLIMRCQGLCQASTVPRELVAQLLEEAGQLLEEA
ncbi:helicase-related protein [Desulfogranum mediterraneum]|uniref:helicase-related protein n=1 Tax=Desulfogranum mediterraneum TaxID=160661 RepID=UPI00041DA9FA|nr:helicase-related protein [Desulfogranum mediterraneum]